MAAAAAAAEPAAGQYRKLQPKRFPPRARRETAEGRFWRSFGAPLDLQQVGAVTSVDFCASPPHDLAVTSSTRVLVYDCRQRALKKTFSRFKDIAYSGSLRPDGQLLVAGGEAGVVQVFDPGSRDVLRQLKGHAGPVHYTRFGRDKLHILSGGDDSTCRWWDMATQEQVLNMGEHTDYVRSGAPSPVDYNVWATGSYDHSVRLWDLRSGKCVLLLQHGRAVEAVTFFPTGGILASAGGTSVALWDILGGGRLLQRLDNHQKTVTSICMSASVSAGPANRAATPRLLTASLDQHVKVYDLDSFQVKHASKYASPILSMGISQDCTTLAVGMATGLLSVRQRRSQLEGVSRARSSKLLAGLPGLKTKTRAPRKRPLQANTYRYFVRGKSEKAAAEDYLVAQRKRVHLAPHDRLLRRFRYADALTVSLRTGRAEVVIAVMEELIARRGLLAALSGRDETSLEPLLRFLVKYIAVPRHSTLLVQVANRILDMYRSAVGLSAATDHQLALLRECVLVEVRLQQSLVSLQGLLQTLLQASIASSS
eukprot:SM000065S20247  [mRNA]  locus=s65:630316:634174:- [translate_table: standard]